MIIERKKKIEIPDQVNNEYAYKFLKELVSMELRDLDVYSSLMHDELTEDEYVGKALTIYEILYTPREMVLLGEGLEIPNFEEQIISKTKNRLKADREITLNDLKEKLEYLKRWSIESSKLTRERLTIEEQVAGYCEVLLTGIEKRKQK